MKAIYQTVYALLLAGSVFFMGGCVQSGRVADGVTVNGVEVGGLAYSQAAEAVRERIAQTLLPLVIHAEDGDTVLTYPQLSFTDDVPSLLRNARQGESLTATVRRTWADAEEFASRFCEEHAHGSRDAELRFSANGFEYSKEQEGVACDYAQLMRDITQALQDGTGEISLVSRSYAPKVTERSLRAQTQLIAEFTTYFDGTNTPRVNNIRLSAGRIAGVMLEPGEEFSFNQTVGLRTEENGYQNATVIQNGEFVDGIGGGVCQTSTTLFNAALLAGMRITESRNHSLTIGYVPPSLDAMVSEYSDLKFVNARAERVYILSFVEGEEITFRFYGTPDGKRRETESKVLMRLPPPPPKIIEGSAEKTVRAEKEGVASESYLLVYGEDGALLSRELIRKDSYATVQGIYQILPE